MSEFDEKEGRKERGAPHSDCSEVGRRCQFDPYRRNSRETPRGLTKPQFAALAFGLLLIFARAATPQTGDGRRPCITGHQFKPGPIVDGHTRQPTPDEFEARMRQLQAWSKTNAGSCSAARL